MICGHTLKAKLDSGASPLDVAGDLVTTKGVHPGEAKRMPTKPGARKGVRRKVDVTRRKVLERARKTSDGRENPPGKSP